MMVQGYKYAGFICAGLLAGLLALPLQAADQKKADASPPVRLEPRALDVLKAMSAKLAGASSLSFKAVTTYEKPSRLGPPLAYATVAQVSLQRPDHLRVLTLGDGPATEFYYDGKQAFAFAPAENLLAVTDAPPTIDGMLEAAYQRAAIYFPFTDVIVANPYQDLARDMRLAFYVGQSRAVGDTTTDVIAYADDNVFVQAWIGTKDKLPRMLRAVFRDDPTQARHQVELSDWKLNSAMPEAFFKPANADKAQRITFAPPKARSVPASGQNPADKP